METLQRVKFILLKLQAFYLFPFLFTINMKLLIMQVEIEIANKEAVIKRNTLLQA